VTTFIKAEVLAVCLPASFRCVTTMQIRKDISKCLRKVTVAAHQSLRGYKAISKYFGVAGPGHLAVIESTNKSSVYYF